MNLKIFVTSLILLLCFHFAATRLNAQEAYKIDGINNPRCDLSEVPPIDPPPYGKFATALRDNPELRGAIVVYGLQGEALRYAKDVRERFNNVAGIAKERLVPMYGGNAEGLRMELWIIPKGAVEPKFDFVEDTKSARKFDTYIYLNDECNGGRLSALTEFAEALKKRPSWQGYIIIHPHTNRRINTDDPTGFISRQQALHRIVKDKTYLVRKYGIDSMRLKAVVGDNDKWTHAELWLVPTGAEPPTAKSSTKGR